MRDVSSVRRGPATVMLEPVERAAEGLELGQELLDESDLPGCILEGPRLGAGGRLRRVGGLDRGRGGCPRDRVDRPGRRAGGEQGGARQGGDATSQR